VRAVQEAPRVQHIRIAVRSWTELGWFTILISASLL
jgi:hypothetical protein